MQSSTIFGNIQFHGIKTIYPLGERVQCFFTVPEVCKPECGDWIGIFPVGWTSIVRDCIVRQMIPYEQLIAGGQFGQVEFELMTHQFVPQQQYQFVYVTNNGECTILGKSKPFSFVSTIVPENVYGGRCMTPMVGGEWFGRFPVQTEMNKLQSELVALEQGLTGEFPTGRPSTWMTTPVIGGCQPPRMIKNVEQIWSEKIRVEQAQRRIEQLCVLAQLKSCERHIMSVMKREPQICEFILRNKLQTKIAAFEQKIQQVIASKMTTTPVEQYVRKYEQLLKEKIQLDIQKRMVVLQKLRLTIRECERKLREVQTIDQEHVGFWQQTLKGKFEQFSRLYNGTEWGKHFETVMGPFWLEHEKQTMHMIQKQRELTYLVNEVCTRLQEFEVAECYTQMRIPRIINSLMFNSHPKLMQIVQLERKIAEQKMKLKMQMLCQTGLMNQINGGCFPEQLTRGIWFTPIIEKLRMIQTHLRQFYQPQIQQQGRFWVEKKLQFIGHLINLFTHFQSEVFCQSVVFDQTKLRNVLVQINELKEFCVEFPRFFNQEQTIGGSISPIVFGELCQHLFELVGEKIVELNKYLQCFEPQFVQMQQQFPLECLFVTVGHQQQMWHQKFWSGMLELVEIERKLVEMKGLALSTIQYMHLDERCVELEKWMRGCTGQEWSTIFEQRPFGKRFVEKLRQIKSLIGEHVEFFPTFFNTTGTFPEQFFQHQQKYEKLCQLIGELECHFVELPVMHTGIYTPQIPFFGGEFPTTTVPQGINYIHQRFYKLVQEFQIQFPECFAPKCEEIVSFLRQWTVRMPTPTTVELLREKLVEFETILCQPECEIACLTTVVFPQSTTSTFKTQRESLRFLIRQVRELKTQLCQCTITENTWFPISEPTTTCLENNLINLFNKKMWTGENVVRSTPMFETIGQQCRIPFRPTTDKIFGGEETYPMINKVFGGEETYPMINKIFGGEETYPMINKIFGGEETYPVNKINRQFGSQYEIVDGCHFEDINNNEWEVVFGGEGIESCLCQMEKHIRKYNGTGLLVESEQLINETCPLCTVVDTTTTGFRRF